MRNLKTVFALALMAFCGINNAQAQDEYATHPYGFVQVQAGGGTTLTDGRNLFGLVSPTFSVGGGYMFTRVVGTRLHVNGWQSKGLLKSIDSKYKFNYINTNVDLMLNLTNMFTKKTRPIVDVYLIGGVGLNTAWDNDELLTLQNNNATIIKENTSNAWGKGTSREKLLGHVARAGVLCDFNISKNLSVGVEVDANSLSDRFNSISKSKDDWMITAQASLTVKFGHKKVQKKAEPVTTTNSYNAAEDEEAKLAAARAKQAEAEERARAEAAKKAEEAAKTAVVAKVEDEPLKETFFYNIRATDPDPETTLNKIAAWCKKYPNKTITVAGYADKGTGTAAVNKKYAMQRAQNVADQLNKKGVDKSRIKVTSYGDTVQPFSENDRNRCVIVVGEK